MTSPTQTILTTLQHASLPRREWVTHLLSIVLPLPPLQDVVTDGSTDGILILGVVLLLCILLPVAWMRRRWNR